MLSHSVVVFIKKVDTYKASNTDPFLENLQSF